MTGPMIHQMLKNQKLIMQQNELIAHQNNYNLNRSYSPTEIAIALDSTMSMLVVERELRNDETTTLCDEYDKS